MDYIITRNNLNIKANFDVIDSTGAMNVPVLVNKGSEDDGSFDSYETQLHFSYMNGIKRFSYLANKDNNGAFLIPAQAFMNGGQLLLNVKLKKGDTIRSSNVLPYLVEVGPNGNTILTPAELANLDDIRNQLTQQSSQIANLEQKIESGNIGGSGLSSIARTLLINLLRNSVYSSDQSENINLLEEELNSGDSPTPPTPTEKYTVTLNLTNASVDNTSVLVNKGANYVANIIVSDDYDLEDVTIKMGDVDITESALNDRTITIANVTDNITITVVANAPQIEIDMTKYNIQLNTTGYRYMKFLDLSVFDDYEKIYVVRKTVGEYTSNWNTQATMFSTYNTLGDNANTISSHSTFKGNGKSKLIYDENGAMKYGVYELDSASIIDSFNENKATYPDDKYIFFRATYGSAKPKWGYAFNQEPTLEYLDTLDWGDN